MKKTSQFSLFLASSVILSSCDQKDSNTYQGIERCEKKYSKNICQKAYLTAQEKDKLKEPMPLKKCENLYRKCAEWKSGYAPVMRGFIVHLSDDGIPYYEALDESSESEKEIYYFENNEGSFGG